MVSLCCRTIVVALVISSVAIAAEKLPPGAAVYENFPAEMRDRLVEGYRLEIKQREAAVASAKKMLAKAQGKTERGAALTVREAAEHALTELKSSNEPPFVGCPLLGKQNAVGVRPWEPGEIGTAHEDPVHVIRVESDSSALVERIDGKQLLLVRGIDTSNWSDDDKKRLPGAWWINGTQRIPTRTGGQVVVPVMVPFEWTDYRKTLKTVE